MTTSPGLNDIFDNVAKLLAAGTTDACFAAFDEAIRHRGFAGFAHAVDDPRLSLNKAVYTSVNPSWRDAYMREGFIAFDPVFAAARHTCAPVSWTDAERGTGPFARMRLHRRAPEVMAAARDHGYRSGFTLPVHRSGLMSVTSCFIQAPTDCEAAAIMARHAGDVSILALHLRERLLSLIELPPLIPALTSRQIEVLHWVSAGKTNAEIALILSMSEHTVSWHLRQAMNRLQVHTRAQAAARAIQLGILAP